MAPTVVQHALLHRRHRCRHDSLPYVRSVSISIVFRGSNPKLLWSERIIPRTATREEVISTAQIAICTPSSRSRIVILRAARRSRSRFDDLVGIGLKHLSHGHRAKEESTYECQQHGYRIDTRIRIRRQG